MTKSQLQLRVIELEAAIRHADAMIEIHEGVSLTYYTGYLPNLAQEYKKPAKTIMDLLNDKN